MSLMCVVFNSLKEDGDDVYDEDDNVICPPCHLHSSTYIDCEY